MKSISEDAYVDSSNVDFVGTIQTDPIVLQSFPEDHGCFWLALIKRGDVQASAIHIWSGLKPKIEKLSSHN